MVITDLSRFRTPIRGAVGKLEKQGSGLTVYLTCGHTVFIPKEEVRKIGRVMNRRSNGRRV